MRSRTLFAAGLVVALVVAAMPSETGSEADLDQTSLEPEVPGVENVSTATKTLPAPTDPVEAEANAPVQTDLDALRTAWTFDLPLANGTVFRLADAHGQVRDQIVIHVRLVDEEGEGDDWPGDVTLVLDGDASTERHAGLVSNDTVRFTLDHQTLVDGPRAAWHLGVEIEAAVTWWSPYDAQQDRAPVPSGGSGASARVLGTTVWMLDTDEDGHPDDRDNCPEHANPDQANLDGDLHGDICDDDDDGDGWTDATEQEMGSDPRDRRSTPLDRDADGHSNDAEHAAGSDPDDPSSVPDDPDADGYRNAVEIAAGSDRFDARSVPSDPDADGLHNHQDNCPRHANPGQADGDADGIGDACDAAPEDGPQGDADGDGVVNADDVCRLHADPGQEDQDGDGLGDACDPDRDGDGHYDAGDAFPDDPAEWHDADGDGIGDNADADDDNDGLSDAAEAALGTDPLMADTDGDTYSDLDELSMASDANDPHDPPYLPTDVRAVVEGNGVRITWTSSGDPRIAGYTVWDRQDLRVVAEVPAAASEARDQTVETAAVMYAVQPRFHGEAFAPDPDRSVDAAVFLEARITAPAQGGGEAATATQAPPADPEPVEDAPGPPVWMLAVLVGAVALLRRRK